MARSEDQSASASSRRETMFINGAVASCSSDEDEQRDRDGLRTREPAAPAREERDEPGGGQQEQRQPADALELVVMGEVAELVSDDDAHFGAIEAAVEQRVPEDHAARRAEADGLGVRRGRLAIDVLDLGFGARDVLDAREPAHVGERLPVVQRVRVRQQIDAEEARQQRDRGEGRRRDAHHQRASTPARPIATSSASETNRNWPPSARKLPRTEAT